jgi:hypothetical protein
VNETLSSEFVAFEGARIEGRGGVEGRIEMKTWEGKQSNAFAPFQINFLSTALFLYVCNILIHNSGLKTVHQLCRNYVLLRDGNKYQLLHGIASVRTPLIYNKEREGFKTNVAAICALAQGCTVQKKLKGQIWP